MRSGWAPRPTRNSRAVPTGRTRWGSCSKRGNLNFNYRILFLPPHLADYLIVHELCHLKEFNHSPRFWALVAQGCPNYHACKKELRAWQ
ncbi:M48 family peptidase [bacterium]|nr:M48 family peptidase [bacterium]